MPRMSAGRSQPRVLPAPAASSSKSPSKTTSSKNKKRKEQDQDHHAKFKSTKRKKQAATPSDHEQDEDEDEEDEEEEEEDDASTSDDDSDSSGNNTDSTSNNSHDSSVEEVDQFETSSSASLLSIQGAPRKKVKSSKANSSSKSKAGTNKSKNKRKKHRSTATSSGKRRRLQPPPSPTKATRRMWSPAQEALLVQLAANDQKVVRWMAGVYKAEDEDNQDVASHASLIARFASMGSEALGRPIKGNNVRSKLEGMRRQYRDTVVQLSKTGAGTKPADWGEMAGEPDRAAIKKIKHWFDTWHKVVLGVKRNARKLPAISGGGAIPSSSTSQQDPIDVDELNNDDQNVFNLLAAGTPQAPHGAKRRSASGPLPMASSPLTAGLAQVSRLKNDWLHTTAAARIKREQKMEARMDGMARMLDDVQRSLGGMATLGRDVASLRSMLLANMHQPPAPSASQHFSLGYGQHATHANFHHAHQQLPPGSFPSMSTPSNTTHGQQQLAPRGLHGLQQQPLLPASYSMPPLPPRQGAANWQPLPHAAHLHHAQFHQHPQHHLQGHHIPPPQHVRAMAPPPDHSHHPAPGNNWRDQEDNINELTQLQADPDYQDLQFHSDLHPELARIAAEVCAETAATATTAKSAAQDPAPSHATNVVPTGTLPTSSAHHEPTSLASGAPPHDPAPKPAGATEEPAPSDNAPAYAEPVPAATAPSPAPEPACNNKNDETPATPQLGPQDPPPPDSTPQQEEAGDAAVGPGGVRRSSRRAPKT